MWGFTSQSNPPPLAIKGRFERSERQQKYMFCKSLIVVLFTSISKPLADTLVVLLLLVHFKTTRGHKKIVFTFIIVKCFAEKKNIYGSASAESGHLHVLNLSCRFRTCGTKPSELVVRYSFTKFLSAVKEMGDLCLCGRFPYVCVCVSRFWFLFMYLRCCHSVCHGVSVFLVQSLMLNVWRQF